MSENKTQLTNEQLKQAVGGGGLSSVEIQTYSDGRWEIGPKTLLVEDISTPSIKKISNKDGEESDGSSSVPPMRGADGDPLFCAPVKYPIISGKNGLALTISPNFAFPR